MLTFLMGRLWCEMETSLACMLRSPLVRIGPCNISKGLRKIPEVLGHLCTKYAPSEMTAAEQFIKELCNYNQDNVLVKKLQ
jgi:hypothetical protein